MMWFGVFGLFLAFPIFPAWEIEKRYEYIFENRIQIGTNVTNLGFGLFQFKWESDNLITGRLIPKHVSNVIDLDDFRALPKKSFQVVLKNGLVTELKVTGEASSWEIEFIRGILSLLQISDLVKEENDFSITEESVAGICKTHYTVTRNSPGIKIIKSRNHTDCEKIPFFHRGIYGTSNYDALTKKRDIIARDLKSIFILKNGHEIETATAEEKIEIVFEKRPLEFISEVKLSRDTSKIKFQKEPSDNADFEIENLISVGGLMYRAKPQSSFCGLNETEFCEIDYYMDPKQFGILYVGDGVYITEKLIKQIAEDLDSPNEIPGKNSLERFSVLVGVLRQMNLSQLEVASKMWENRRQEAFVFQSAVFQAGTLDCLEMIRSLRIKKQLNVLKILINELPGKVHPLSLGYLDTLFEFATDSELMEDDFEFSKEIFLAFSNLVRRYLSEKEKPFEQKELNKLISTKYRKYLSKKLQNSLAQKDDLKLQIYVRVIGNMADLTLFKSYLSRNSEKLTSHQKAFIVNSMDKTVELYPKKSRDFLMTIYKNSNETFPVRAAAIFLLVKTDLPEDVVLEMIEIAKDSTDVKLQLAVKFSILSKSFNYHSNEKINEYVQAMQINADVQFDRQFDFLDFSVKKLKTDFHTEAIRGNGNPRSGFVQGQINNRGFKSSFRFGGMIDEIQDFILSKTTTNASAIKTNFVIDTDFTQIFLPYANLNFSLPDFIKYLQKYPRAKFCLLTMSEVSLAFPTESGLPFLYSYQSPKLIYFEGAASIEDSFNFDVNAIFSEQTQIKMGFVNPLTKKYYVQGTGIDRHVNIPLAVSYKKIEYFHRNKNVFVAEPVFRTENKRIVHLATRPYAAVLDLFPVEPVKKIENIPNNLREDLFYDARFRLKFRSSSIGPKGNIFDYLQRPELKAYFFPGLFGEIEPTFNVFEVFFDNKRKVRTSLTAELDLPNAKVMPVKNTSAVGEQKIFEIVVELSGPTTRSVALESLYEVELYSKAYRFTGKGSYWENNAKLYEASFFYVFQKSKQKIWANSPQEESKALFGIGNDTIEIFSKFAFGKPLEEGNFISAEAEIDPVGFATNPNEVFDVTVDFHGLPDKMVKEVCQFEGEFFLAKLIASNVKVTRKNPGKCVTVE